MNCKWVQLLHQHQKIMSLLKTVDKRVHLTGTGTTQRYFLNIDPSHANPMLSSLRIFSAVIEDFFPSQSFLYSARCVETHRPRAVFSLNRAGT